jgi:5'-nucleotidase
MYEMFGLHMPDFVAVARELVRTLRAEGAAPIALLSHLGLNDDRKVAASVPGLDLIIGGHSHSLLPEGEMVNGVLIAQAGNYAEGVGRVELTLRPGTGAVVDKSARVLPVPADEPPDPSVLEAIADAERETEVLLARTVGELREPLGLDHFGECGIGNLTADAVRQRMHAECAIIASGNFHRPLPGGRIVLADLDAACFSSANPAVTPLRGGQIRAALEKGLDTAFTGQTPKALHGVRYIGCRAGTGVRSADDLARSHGGIHLATFPRAASPMQDAGRKRSALRDEGKKASTEPQFGLRGIFRGSAELSTCTVS